MGCLNNIEHYDFSQRKNHDKIKMLSIHPSGIKNGIFFFERDFGVRS
jgi:hypothetical protein